MKPKNSTRARLAPLVLAISLMLGACAADKPIVPPPLVKPRAETKAEFTPISGNPIEADSAPKETTLQSTPKPPPPSKLSTVKPASRPSLATDTKEEATITVAFDQMPLPNFVQAIYGLILRRTYSMDPQVAARKDLVTLRASALQTPTQIESAARMLLKTYGVAVTDLGAGNYRISPDNTQTGYAPEILRGRALPEVPMALRPIYQMVEMNAVRSTDIASWLTKVFGNKVSIQDDFTNNTLILSGQSDEVTAVLSAIHVLDQPLMKGRLSQRINPAFWSSDDLSRKLVELLNAEGYRATIGPSGNFPINLVSIPGVNAIIVFTADPTVMQHVADWVKDLDKPSPSRGSGGGYFTYKARYTNAENLAKTMQSVMGDPTAQAPAQQAIPAGAIVVGPANGAPVASSKSGRVIVNAATNTLIFQGGNDNPTQLLSLLQELDKPARAALIEVTVAEVTLDNTTQMGVEWALVNSGANVVGGTLGGIALGGGLVTSALGTGTKGLTIAQLGSAGDLRALLNMLATSTNANVLSSPRILARSGETASIQVGSEIPTIQQQQTSSATAGSTGVLQSVQYRKTGIILNVKPIIYAGDRIDLDVTQEVSDSSKVGVAGSPIIDTRKIDTHLSLKDGTPVLLGGLISQKNSRADIGVPLLKDIPVVGQLFRTNTDNNSKTELLVLITPYIVADDHDATAITEAFRNQLGEWARTPGTPTNPTPVSSGGVTNRQTPP